MSSYLERISKICEPGRTDCSNDDVDIVLQLSVYVELWNFVFSIPLSIP